MKNILVLNGSPRGLKGNTQILVEHFLEGYKEADQNISVKQVALSKTTMNHCTGCFGCWTKSPGRCVLSDDMDVLFDDYVNADVVIWATPLYHYGMTSIMKKFIERTLPLSHPKIEKIGDKYSHPERYSLNQEHILISNCGFPEQQNFNVLEKSFERITGKPVATILCVMGELLRQKPLYGRIGWYLEAVKTAGQEAALEGSLSKETSETLSKFLVPIEEFVDMANVSWNVNKEMVEVNNLPGANNISQAFQFLKLMNYSFNPSAAIEMEAVLEMMFIDTNEVFQFHIKDGKSILVQGSLKEFTTQIKTTYKTWLDISEGRVDGAKAMLDGLYKVDGDINFMMGLSKLYGSDEELIDSHLENKKILGIPKSKWMGLTFIPWIFSWVFAGKSIMLGVWLPLMIMLTMLLAKRNEKSVTYFEQSSGLYFSVLGIITLIGMRFSSAQVTLLNYFAIAIIWGISVLLGNPLTADYSKYEQEKDLSNNIIFIKTNDHLTLFWSFIFIVQGMIHHTLELMDLGKFVPLIYILTFASLKFTTWYSKWYPQKIMRG